MIMGQIWFNHHFCGLNPTVFVESPCFCGEVPMRQRSSGLGPPYHGGAVSSHWAAGEGAECRGTRHAWGAQWQIGICG